MQDNNPRPDSLRLWLTSNISNRRSLQTASLNTASLNTGHWFKRKSRIKGDASMPTNAMASVNDLHPVKSKTRTCFPLVPMSSNVRMCWNVMVRTFWNSRNDNRWNVCLRPHDAYWRLINLNCNCVWMITLVLFLYGLVWNRHAVMIVRGSYLLDDGWLRVVGGTALVVDLW